MGRVERPDLQDGFRDALALVRAFMNPDPDEAGWAFHEILKVYPREVEEIVFPLLGICVGAARSSGESERLEEWVEGFARHLAAR